MPKAAVPKATVHKAAVPKAKAALPDADTPAAAGATAAAIKRAKTAYFFFCEERRAQIKGGCCYGLYGQAPRLGRWRNTVKPTVFCSLCSLSAETDPELTFGEVGAKLGAAWKELSEVDKAPFKVSGCRCSSPCMAKL